jgi:hypothetical protein
MPKDYNYSDVLYPDQATKSAREGMERDTKKGKKPPTKRGKKRPMEAAERGFRSPLGGEAVRAAESKGIVKNSQVQSQMKRKS